LCVLLTVAVPIFICIKFGVDYGIDIAQEW